jgi:hypothetical protein
VLIGSDSATATLQPQLPSVQLQSGPHLQFSPQGQTLVLDAQHDSASTLTASPLPPQQPVLIGSDSATATLQPQLPSVQLQSGPHLQFSPQGQTLVAEAQQDSVSTLATSPLPPQQPVLVDSAGASSHTLLLELQHDSASTLAGSPAPPQQPVFVDSGSFSITASTIGASVTTATGGGVGTVAGGVGVGEGGHSDTGFDTGLEKLVAPPCADVAAAAFF